MSTDKVAQNKVIHKVARKNVENEDAPTFPKWVRHAAWFLRKFGELSWLKNLKNFIFDLVVQASELLIVLALVISMVNYLTGGALVASMPWLSQCWAWLQAIAIDAGFGVVLVNFLESLRGKNWVQALIYFVLTGLLGFNAGAVTYIDSLATAAHLPMTDIGVNPFPLWVLSLTRAIAVVGFLGVARIHSYDFTDIRIPSFFLSVKEDLTVNIEEAAPTEITTAPQAQIEAPADSKIVEEANDDQATIITMPQFPQKRKPDVVRKIVEVQKGGKPSTAQRIADAIKELEAKGEKVTDGKIAQMLEISRATVMRNKPNS
jgi:hypothetical protein